MFINKFSLLNFSNSRLFWGGLNKVFNRVDTDRIKEIGPDKACCEWLLRNGAKVLFVGHSDYLGDYNGLEDIIKQELDVKIQAIDATESSITHDGFEHFKNCVHIKKLILHKCNYILNEAIPNLSHLSNSLNHLQLSSCGNVSDTGVKSLHILRNLTTLILFDLIEVKNKEDCVAELKSKLPKCDIKFT